MNPILSPDAIEDLSEIYDYISLDRPDAADRLLDRLHGAFQQIAEGELNGPQVRMVDGRRGQKWSVSPYRIYYQRTRNRTTILRVYHGARQPIER